MIKPKDIINGYTDLVGGSYESTIFETGIHARLTVQSFFTTIKEAREWEEKFAQFILENRQPK